MEKSEFFRVNTEEYVAGTQYWVVRPASINNPKNSAVMFITTAYPTYRDVFFSVSGCLIFWPREWEIPQAIAEKNAVYPCENPHLFFAKFFAAHKITGLYSVDEFEIVNGAYIAKTAKIGKGTTVFPGAYIGGDVIIGEDCFIGAGVKIVSRTEIGNRVWIRENTVIGTDDLTTDRDEAGHPVGIPQFGKVRIEDDVTIGANSVVSRGAIDETVLYKGCKIDSLTFISHNVHVGAESFIVGQTLLFGSASIGRQAQVSGGCVVGNYVKIGDRALLGMGATAPRNIPDNCVAYGTPARPVRKRFEE